MPTFLLFIFCIVTSKIFCCSCGLPNIERGYQGSNIIFYGKHLDIKSSKDFYGITGIPLEMATFEVLKCYKGIDEDWFNYVKSKNNGKYILSLYSTCGESCGTCFDSSSHYLVYCRRHNMTSQFIAGDCSRTRIIEDNNFLVTNDRDKDFEKNEVLVLQNLAIKDTTQTDILSHWAQSVRQEQILRAEIAQKEKEVNHLKTILKIILLTFFVIFIYIYLKNIIIKQQ